MDIIKKLESLPSHQREFLIRKLPYKLAELDEIEQYIACLIDFNYLSVRVSELEIREIINDYDLIFHKNLIKISNCDQEKDGLRIIQQVLQQSAHILKEDNKQLPAQLLARLHQVDNPVIEKLLAGRKENKLNTEVKGAKDCRVYPWLQPLTVGLSSIEQPFEKNIPTGHDGVVDVIVISGDGNWMLSAKKNKVKLWNISTGENKLIFDISEILEREEDLERAERRKINTKITALALSFDGRQAVVGFDAYSHEMDNFIEVWNLDAESRKACLCVATKGTIETLGISESGEQIAIGFSGGELFTVWALNEERTNFVTTSLKDTLFTNESRYGAVAISPNGRWVVTVSDKFLLLWDIGKGRLVRSLSIVSKSEIKALTLSWEGIIRAVFADGTLDIWKVDISDRSNNLSIERGVAKLNRRRQIQYGDARYLRDAFIALVVLLRQSPKILGLLSWSSKFLWANEIIFCFILQVQKPLLRLYRCLTYDRKNPKFFAERSIRPSDLAFLWRLVQLFSAAKPQRIAQIALNGLNMPETITADGRIGLAKTKTDEVQLIDLQAACHRVTNKKDLPTNINRRQFSEIYEPWEQAIAISLDGKWLFSLAKDDTLQMWDVSTRQPYLRLKQKKISSFWERLKSDKTYPPSKKELRFNDFSLKFWTALDPRHLSGIIFLYQSPIVRKCKKVSVFLYHLCHQDLLIKDIDLVAKSLNGRWLFLISKNNFDVRDLGKRTNENGKSRWYLRDVSSNGQWALWQSSTKTLRLTNLRTGELAGVFHDYFGDLADTDRWSFAWTKEKNPWKQYSWSYETKINNDVAISTNGNSVLIYDNSDFDTWMWRLFQYLVRWDVRNGDSNQLLSQYHTIRSRLIDGKESSQEKWILSITCLDIFSDNQRLIFGLEDGKVKLCNLSQEINTLLGHTMRVTAISISQDELWAVSCSLDQTLKVWYLPSCKQVASFTTDSPFYNCRIAQIDGQLFVVAGDAAKRTHVLQLRLPDNYDLPSEENNAEESIPQYKIHEVRQLGLSLEDYFAGKPVRSDVFVPDNEWQRSIGIPLPLYRLKTLPEERNSEVGIDYTNLITLLKIGLWMEAEQETKKLFTKALGKENHCQDFKPEEIRSFPRADLLTMDRLWLKYSNGRYGFSLQMRVWEKFHHNYFNFLRIIGREDCDICTFIPCESIEMRRGFYPLMSFSHDHQLARKFYTRLAECSDYHYIGEPLEQSEVDRMSFDYSSSLRETSNFEIEISQPSLSKSIHDFSSKEEYYKCLLNDALSIQDWKEANKITFQWLSDYVSVSIENLRTIDYLWLQHSRVSARKFWSKYAGEKIYNSQCRILIRGQSFSIFLKINYSY